VTAAVALAADEPLAVVVRSGVVESVHRGRLVIVDPDGAVVHAWGDVDTPVLTRSCAKPLQAAALAELGLDLDGHRLAVAAGSHAGEAFHLAAVAEILEGSGVPCPALRCPASLPDDALERDDWIRDGRPAAAIAHNCSGKHAAMLATSRSCGWSLDDYLDPEAPLQRAVAAATGSHRGPGGQAVVDGCGAPVILLSLVELAGAFGRLAAASGGPSRRVADAIRSHPEYVSGTRRDESALHRQVDGLVAKAGGEGTYAIGLASGHGIALKVTDGTYRARPAIVAAALGRLGVAVDLDAFCAPITGGDRVVGGIESTLAPTGTRFGSVARGAHPRIGS